MRSSRKVRVLRKLLQMFGMSELSEKDAVLRDLATLLSRSQPVNTIASLLAATQNSPQPPASLNNAAVCLDTNVFLHLANTSERAQIIDYLASKHNEPLIVSAQSIQEIWNNYLSGIETVASEIRSKLEALSKVVAPLDSHFADYKQRFEGILNEFRDDFGHLYKDGIKERVRSLIDILERKALFCEVPRALFESYYSVRKITKTPPGFKDDGAGDYFIWLDFLYGLKIKKVQGASFTRAILVSDDRKVDWVRGAVAHPTLCAECMSFVGVPLEIWNLKRLAEATK